jgi:hypothetical protein
MGFQVARSADLLEAFDQVRAYVAKVVELRTVLELLGQQDAPALLEPLQGGPGGFRLKSACGGFGRQTAELARLVLLIDPRQATRVPEQ